jgi:transcriptional regulator with XRE-family HTH domain
MRNHARLVRRYRGVMPTTLSERLIGAMEIAEISKAELARMVGVTRSAVTHWVNGTSPNIRPEHLFRIADALNIEARWLATGEGPRARQRLSLQQTRLLDAYHQLPPDAREAVAVLMCGIADKAGTYKP